MSEPHTTITLKSSQFRKEREQSWQQLEQLLERVRRSGITSLPPDALERLPLLYRSVLSSLSVARAIALDRHLLLYLEDLSLRAYLVVYGPQTSIAEAVRRFLGHGLPAAVRSARWHIVIALVALLAGTVMGFMLTVGDEAWFSVFVPAPLNLPKDRSRSHGRN